jgi:hypothetical protein
MSNAAMAAAEREHLAEPERRCEDCLEAEPTAPDGLCDDCAADRQAESDEAELAKDLP